MSQKRIFIVLIAVLVLLGAGLVSVADLCAYTPKTREISISTLVADAESTVPEALMRAAQADARREIGAKGEALPGSSTAVYDCDGQTCTLRRLLSSVVLAPRCPLPSDEVIAVDYDFVLSTGVVRIDNRSVTAELDQMVAEGQDTTPTFTQGIDTLLTILDADFRTTYPAYTVSLDTVGSYWNVSVQPADSTSSYMLFYQIGFDGTVIRGG